MSKKYTVQHLGYPTTKVIQEDEWKDYSKHASEKAAWRAITKATQHLDHGSWNDHYRVLAPDGTVCSQDRFIDEQAQQDYNRRGYK